MKMRATARVKIVDNEFCIMIPDEIIKKEHITAGEEVVLDIKKHGKRSMTGLFGSLKNWKVDSQKVKDELRVEWSK